jgi:hypothetical protein
MTRYVTMTAPVARRRAEKRVAPVPRFSILVTATTHVRQLAETPARSALSSAARVAAVAAEPANAESGTFFRERTAVAEKRPGVGDADKVLLEEVVVLGVDAKVPEPVPVADPVGVPVPVDDAVALLLNEVEPVLLADTLAMSDGVGDALTVLLPLTVVLGVPMPDPEGVPVRELVPLGEGVPLVVPVPESAAAATTTSIAPPSMRSCTLLTPASFMRATRVPSVSSVDRESRGAVACRPRTPAGCARRAAAAPSALGGSFTPNT